ncbi:MAG: glycosyltransferase family 1 protein [Gaiellales bacterium]|nr:MAG: glycosyltransferase family 1 protein [Gaiellales bacterium]
MTTVGFDTRFISSSRTGLGTYSRSLLSALIGQGSRYDFCLFTSDASSLDEFTGYDHVHIHEVGAVRFPAGGRLGSLIYEQFSLAAAIARQKPNLVHFPYYVEPALTRKPFIVTIHDLDTFLPSGRHSAWTRAYHNNLARIMARRADAVITISEYSRGEIMRYLDIPREKVHVIYDGLADNFRETLLADTHASPVSKSSSNEYFLYAGGLGMRKNLRRMVDAFALAREVNASGVRLVITGELAEVGSALMRYSDDKGYGDFIEFAGYVDDDALPGLYRGALASIYPSLNEGFGLPVIESMACGTPVITSRDSAMEEIAGGRAILIDPYDVTDMAAAIGALMDDRSLAASIGAAGFEQAGKYSWDDAAERCIELYGRILARRGANR